MQWIANLDREKYAGASERAIRSETLVLTEKQKQHIISRRGQNFFDRYSPYFREIAEQPDYVFKDRHHKDTAIASKTVSVDGASVNLVIRLAVEGDGSKLENSIITAILESEKRYRQRLRNNLALYKRA